MKILITGVHGFVGSNLVEALKKEHTIYGLDIISPMKDEVRFTFSWDYLDKPNEIPEVDAIIHLAGKAHDTKNKKCGRCVFQGEHRSDAEDIRLVPEATEVQEVRVLQHSQGCCG